MMFIILKFDLEQNELPIYVIWSPPLNNKINWRLTKKIPFKAV
jgi:hypothetical protein